MKNLLIHIGYHKTATTSLQAFLSDNSAQLRKSGVNYAKTGREGHSHARLANALKPENKNRRESARLWARLLGEVEQSKCSATLISSECFLENKEIPEVLAAIVGRSVQVGIICYLRPQLDWLESVYSEVIKDPYRRYIGDVYSLREVEQGWLDYYSILNLWSNAFGSSSLSVRSFEQSVHRKGGIYDDFTDVLGLTLLPGMQIPRNQNESLHPSLTEFLRRCNMVPMLNSIHIQLVGALKDISKAVSVDLPRFALPVRRLSHHQWLELQPVIERSNTALSAAFLGCEGGILQGFFGTGNDYDGQFIDEAEILPSLLEHRIFDELPLFVRTHLESASRQISERTLGRSFLPLPPKDVVSRLRAITIRQRIETRQLYDQLNAESLGRTRGILLRALDVLRRIRSR